MAYVNLGQVIYPVGAIYASANSTSPASLFGGNWTQITNAALRGSTRVGYTGADTHTLTINEMPSHNHLDQSRVSWSDNMSGGMHMSYVSQSNFQTDKVIYTSNTGGVLHTQSCNALSIVICGNAQAKSSRGDVTWLTSI